MAKATTTPATVTPSVPKENPPEIVEGSKSIQEQPPIADGDKIKNAPPIKDEIHDGDVPAMTDEEMAKAIQAMPPYQREMMEKYFAAKNSANPEKSKTPPAVLNEPEKLKTPLQQEDEKAALDAEELHEHRIKKYGQNYVVVQKPSAPGQPMMQKVFSAHAWKNLGPGAKDGSKEGWKVAVKTPPEVQNLKSKL